MSHNKFLLGIAIPSKNKGTSSLTAVDTPVRLTDFLQAQHSRPVLGHHPVLAQHVQPHISSQQPGLSLTHGKPLCNRRAAQSADPAGAT